MSLAGGSKLSGGLLRPKEPMQPNSGTSSPRFGSDGSHERLSPATTLEPPILSCGADRTPGRRFYVHEYSFSALAASFPRLSLKVFSALSHAVASRIARHHLIDGTHALGLSTNTRFQSIVARLDFAACDSLTLCFRELVRSSTLHEEYGATARLLLDEERVYALCWESGYFTFATDAEAAEIMFEETGSLRALRRHARERPENFRALEIVSGASLFPLLPEIGVGPDTLSAYPSRTLPIQRVRAL